MISLCKINHTNKIRGLLDTEVQPPQWKRRPELLPCQCTGSHCLCTPPAGKTGSTSIPVWLFEAVSFLWWLPHFLSRPPPLFSMKSKRGLPGTGRDKAKWCTIRESSFSWGAGVGCTGRRCSYLSSWMTTDWQTDPPVIVFRVCKHRRQRSTDQDWALDAFLSLNTIASCGSADLEICKSTCGE